MWAQLNYLESREQYYSFCGFFSSLFLYFFVFSALGSASFSLDTHYKVNSNCTLGHSGETGRCPQAKALSRTLKCELPRYWFAYFSLTVMHANWLDEGGGGVVIGIWLFGYISLITINQPYILIKDRASRSHACYFFDVSLLTACSSIFPPPPLFFLELSSVPSVPSIWKGIVEQAWQRAAQRCGGKPSTAGRDSVLFAWKCVKRVD